VTFPGILRSARRLSVLVGGLGIGLVLHGAWRLARRPSPWPQRFLAFSARTFGADLRVEGPVPRGGLIAANHLSWLDILLIGGATGCAFVGRANLRTVPLVGRLCRINRTVFVERENRAGVAGQVASLRSALTAGAVTVFPEGTTGDDLGLLPFKPALFAALDPPLPGALLHPARIDYGAATADLAWVGDESGLAHAKRVLARRGRFAATLRFAEPIDPAATRGRKAMAAEAHARVAGLAPAPADPQLPSI
jgi:1-acyl-sn-glycerol-3-phosphate acyltransferase